MKKIYNEIAKMDFPARKIAKEQQARILERAMERIDGQCAIPARRPLPRPGAGRASAGSSPQRPWPCAVCAPAVWLPPGIS